MGLTLATYSGDRRLVMANAEAIRQPIYMAPNPQAATADAGTDLVTLAAHGFSEDTWVMITGTAPTGLTAGNYYAVKTPTTDTFKLGTTAGVATTIDITAAGGPFNVVKQDWVKLRIGLRGAIIDPGAASITGVQLVIGANKGNTHGFGSVSTEHFVGWRFAGNWTYNAGPTPYFSSVMTALNHMIKKIGAAITTTAGSAGTGFFSADSAVRNGIFVEILKPPYGPPAGSFRVLTYGPQASTAAQSDLTDAEFNAIMELPSLGDIATVKANYGVFVSTAANISVNENTNGILDHVLIYWDKSGPKFSFDIKHRTVPIF